MYSCSVGSMNVIAAEVMSKERKMMETTGRRINFHEVFSVDVSSSSLFSAVMSMGRNTVSNPRTERMEAEKINGTENPKALNNFPPKIGPHKIPKILEASTHATASPILSTGTLRETIPPAAVSEKATMIPWRQRKLKKVQKKEEGLCIRLVQANAVVKAA